MCEELRLERYDNSPWGFRLTGGLDFGTPLSIIKVTGGSIAEECGVQAGDLVKYINGKPTTHFTHLDAQKCIASAGNYLTLTVLRGSVVTPPATPIRGLSPAPESFKNGSVRGTPSPTIMKTEVEGEIMDYYNHVRSTDVRDGSRSPAPVYQKTGQKATVTKPKYSVNDEGQLLLGDRALSDFEIAELLTSNEEVLDQGVLGINFKKFLPKVDFIRKSEVFKMLQSENTKKEISEQAQLQKEPNKRFSTFLMKPRGPSEKRGGLTFVKFKPPRYLPKPPEKKWELPKLKPWERPKRTDPEHSVLWLFLEEKGEEVIDERWGTDEEERINLSRNSFVEYDRSTMSSSLKMHDDDTCSVASRDHYDHTADAPKEGESPFGKDHTNESCALGEFDRVHSQEYERNSVVSKSDQNLYSRAKVNEGSVSKGEKAFSRKDEMSEGSILKKEEMLCEEELTHEKYESMKKEEERLLMNEQTHKVKRDIQTFGDQEKVIRRTPKFIIESKLECVESVQYDHEEKKSENVNVKEEYSSLEHKKSVRRELVEQLAEIQEQIEALEYEAPSDLQSQLLAVKEQLSKIVQIKTSGEQTYKADQNESKSYKDSDQVSQETIHNVSRRNTSNFSTNVAEEGNSFQQQLNARDEALVSPKNINTFQESSISSFESSRNTSACYESSRDTSEHHGTVTERIEHLEEVSKEHFEVSSFQLEKHEEREYEMCVAPLPKPLKKSAHPITPQLRPIVLPGGRMWRQPKDAEHEEFYQGILVAQAEVLIGSTEGLNYTKYVPPKVDMSTSEVYRLIHESEGQKAPTQKEPEPNYSEPINKRHFYAATLKEPAPIGTVELSEL